MRLLDALSARTAPNQATEQRLSLDEIVKLTINGANIIGPGGSMADEVDGDLKSRIHQIHNRHGVVAAAVVTRALLLSQVRFKWRRTDGTLYGNRDLSPLERPGSQTRPELLTQMAIDVSYTGTAIVVRRDGGLFRLNPDKVRFVLSSASSPTWSGDSMVVPFDVMVEGIIYDAGVGRNGETVALESFSRGEFAVWAPEPDPNYPWRGLSWISSVAREMLIDGQVTDHEGKFFEKAATPGLVFMMDPSRTPDEIKAYSEVVNDKFAGVRNSYKNMFLGGATDVKVVGSSMKDLGLGELQGTFENRVAVRSRIPAVVLGTKEALSGSSLNAGNYSAARRMLADGWFSPTVDNLCATLEAIVPPPGDGTELGFDASRVLFLQEDQKDAADITQTNAVAMRQLVEAGFEPKSVVDAVTTGDMSKLTHTGNVSVQLQPPGSQMQSNSADIIADVRSVPIENHVHMPSVVMPDNFAIDLSPLTGVIDDARRSSLELTGAVTRMAGQELPPPVIHVNVPQQAAPTVEVNVPQQAAPVVNVAAADVRVVLEEQRTKHRVRRDNKGNITEIVEEPA